MRHHLSLLLADYGVRVILLTMLVATTLAAVALLGAANAEARRRGGS